MKQFERTKISLLLELCELNVYEVNGKDFTVISSMRRNGLGGTVSSADEPSKVILPLTLSPWSLGFLASLSLERGSGSLIIVEGFSVVVEKQE